jgi:hypothetical protein
MQKYFSLIAFILTASGVFAQRSIDSMVQAEKNFANTSLVASTKEAFVKFIDTAGIVFEKGTPVNGFELYTKSERDPAYLRGSLNMQKFLPQMISVIQPVPGNITPTPSRTILLQRATFITVWHLNNNGEWKFLIDFGINYNLEQKKRELKKVKPEKKELKKDLQQSLKEAEEKFIQSYKTQGKQAYSSFLSSNSRLNYAGYLPALNSTERKALIDSLPANIGYSIVGFGSSPKNDLGYVYGTADINDKHEGYLRIWRREKDGWKIAVEVLHFK